MADSGQIKRTLGIVIVHYRDIKKTLECLRSIAQCKQDDWKIEIVIIDNSQTTHPEFIQLQRFDISIIQTKNNDGYAAALNHGITWAQQAGLNYILLLKLIFMILYLLN